MEQIPFNISSEAKNEKKYLSKVLNSRHLQGDGPFTQKCQSYINSTHQGFESFLTTSCTDALELAALLLDIKFGDEYIIPSYTFPSTANAFALRGAKIIFCDNSLNDFNLCLKDLAKLITKKTKGIVTVNYAGIPCNYNKIRELINGRNILIIEDNAQGFLSEHNGKKLGTYGDLATVSFHNTKNISCGEGGALLIPKNKEKLIKKAKVIREKGTNREQFIRGEVDKYTWQNLGSSFLPSELNAAVLLANLEEAKIKTKKRQVIWNEYFNNIIKNNGNFQLPIYMKDYNHNAHMFPILAKNKSMRDYICDYAKENHISIISHYEPLSISPFAIKNNYTRECPNAQEIANRLFRIPIFEEIKTDQVIRVIDFLGNCK